jgi:NodT family efflux transporter outer membrane factor (OMF) lipoprotein
VLRKRYYPIYPVLLSVLLLSGCAAGPDFRRPKAPDIASYTTGTPFPAGTEAAPVAGGGPQKLETGRDIPAQWWIVFRSPELDGLIRQALANSPTLAAAQAALRRSREDLNARSGAALYPAVDAGLTASRRQITGAGFGQPNTSFSPFTLYNASVGVSYSLDLFGGTRRELEALRSQVDLRQYLLAGADLALTANIVTAAVKDASLRATIRAASEIADGQARQLEIVERQFQAGAVAKTDVLAQRTQLAQTRALLPPLEKELAQNRHLLAVLSGRFRAARRPSAQPAVLPGPAAARHPGRRVRAARGERGDRRGDGEPVSPDHPERQLRVRGGQDRRPVHGRERGLEPRRGSLPAIVPRR